MFLTFGEALIDLIPAPGEGLQDARSLAIQPGGAPLNVAIALKRLGVPVTFVGSLSTDAFGSRLSQLLAGEGIPRIPERRVDATTRLAVVDHAAPADASFRFYGHDTADTVLSTSDVDTGFDLGPTGIYITSLLVGSDQFAPIQRYAVKRATAQGISIFTDPNPRPPAWNDRSEMRSAVSSLLASSDYAKISLQDARVLGWKEEPVELISTLEHKYAVRVIVTDGERGCWAQVDGEVVHVEAPAVTSIDPTGAGDAFFGALIASVLGAGRLTISGLRGANTAGALATTTQGAVASIPSSGEIQRLLAESQQGQ